MGNCHQDGIALLNKTIDFLWPWLLELAHVNQPAREGRAMRRIIIPLVFVVLLTIAAVVPVAAGGGSSSGAHPTEGCDFSSDL